MINKDRMTVNIFGSPGSGKSTTSALIYAYLKLELTANIQLVREYATDLIAETGVNLADPVESEKYQVKINNQQLLREERYSSSDIIVTDSPLYLNLFFLDTYKELPNKNIHFKYHRQIAEARQNTPHYNLFLNPPLTKDNYEQSCRSHSQQESVLLSRDLREFLNKHNVVLDLVTTKQQVIQQIPLIIQNILGIYQKSKKNNEVLRND